MVIKQILIIDDEIEIANTLRDFLQLIDMKLSCLIAKNGNEGLELIKNNKIHCVVTDTNMPICDGLTFIKKLREQGFDIPVIFISGEADEELEKMVEKIGSFAFLLKPFDMDVLGTHIEDALAKVS
jgi:DNA-binding NtrC family response regulator